jgi:glycosyltransferase involved in cell wall biosynthesis
VHLIGLKLKQSNKELKWIADFRDPWSEWDLLDTLSLSFWARARHKKMEKKVLTTADEVITIAPYHVDRFQVLGGRKVQLITNGYDEDDFANIVHTPTEKFIIRHVGVVDELRDPQPVMEAIKELCNANSDFAQHVHVEFIGKVNSSFKNRVNEDVVLKSVTQFTDHMPHDQLLKVYGSTNLQLLVLAHTAIAPGNLPGKFFEYLASGNPILAIGPVQGDAAHVLNESQAGEIHERTDATGIRKSLLSYYQDWKQGATVSRKGAEKFTRRYLTRQLIQLLERL